MAQYMSPSDPLPLLRDTVRIVADPSAPGFFYAQIPGTRQIVGLSPAQAYLAEGLRQPYSEVVLLTKCNARFSENLSVADLHELTATLDGAGMMGSNAQKADIQDSGEPDGKIDLPPDADDGAARVSYRNHWSLCRPRKYLDRILPALAFFRYLNFLLPFAFILGMIGFFQNLDLFFLDISSIKSQVSFLGRVLFSLFTISLITQLYRGLTARHFGFDTPSFGLILVFGLLPRFNMRTTIPEDAGRRARLWILGAPIYIRFIVFPVCVVLWLVTRNQGTLLPQISAGLAMITMISLLFVVNPLLGGAGYRFLSEYFATPNLRKRAFARFKSFFSRQPDVVRQYVDRSPAVLVYGVLSILFTLLLIGFIGFMVARWLELTYQGLGVAVFLLVIVYLFFRFGYQGLVLRRKRRKATLTANQPGMRNAAVENPSPGKDQSKRGAGRSFLPWRLLFFIAFLGLCFLPYQYESGGEAEVFPIASAAIYAEYPDLVDKIYYHGGEILERGTVIAEMVNDRQKHDVTKGREEIRKKKEDLSLLLTTPIPEQIVLAEEEIKKSEVLLQYSRQQSERMKKMYEKQVVSYVDYESALRQMEIDQQLIQSARANLDYVKNQVNQHTIKSTRIEILMLENQLTYFQQVLERTRLKMPIDGQITTMNLQNLLGSHLDTDIMFAEVQDLSKVRIEIKIPESDIAEAVPDAPVTIRLRAYPNRTFTGRVRNIYPATITDAFGRYIICDCIVANENTQFTSGMTGFAKIKGEETFAINAFSRALIRFVKVEVWSWLP